jgi:hypothetical protein
VQFIRAAPSIFQRFASAAVSAAGRLISDPLNVELVEEFELTSKSQIQKMSEKLVINPKI